MFGQSSTPAHALPQLSTSNKSLYKALTIAVLATYPLHAVSLATTKATCKNNRAAITAGPLWTALRNETH
jgi:hypothetical protein